MEMPSEKLWEVINNILNEKPELGDEEVFMRWINENEANKKIYKILSQLKLKQPLEISRLKETNLLRIKSEINNIHLNRKLQIWKWSAVASIVLFITLFSLYLVGGIKENEFIETKTSLGNKTKITLIDGTTVLLNSNSTLKYRKAKSHNRAQVILDGEAFFEVTKNKKYPFEIIAGDLKIKVFGTKLNIKAYKADEIIETTLLEGSLGIFDINDEKHVILKPKQIAVYNKISNHICIKETQPELKIGWIKDKYYFDSERFSSIIKLLEESYHIPIKVNSEKLKNEIFSGQFEKKESVFQLLNAMKRNNCFNYKYKNDTIYIDY